VSDRRGGLPAYTFEYNVRREPSEPPTGPSLNQHSLSVVVSRGTELFTFTATAPEDSWNAKGKKKTLEECAKSFKLESNGVRLPTLTGPGLLK
jgi:hypothetical protein